jgi:hypothetical protein
MKESFFDGKVLHSLVLFGNGTWSDRWEGPGGNLHAEVVGARRVRERYTDLDGNEAVEIHMGEGPEYVFLKDVFGPELWAEYLEPKVVDPESVNG